MNISARLSMSARSCRLCVSLGESKVLPMLFVLVVATATASRLGHWERHVGFDSDPGANFIVRNHVVDDADFGQSASQRVNMRAVHCASACDTPLTRSRSRTCTLSAGVPFRAPCSLSRRVSQRLPMPWLCDLPRGVLLPRRHGEPAAASARHAAACRCDAVHILR